MIPAAQELLPGAPIWYLGLYRDEETLQPVATTTSSKATRRSTSR